MYSYEQLKKSLKQGKKHTFIGFYGSKTESLRDRSFSNFYKCRFAVPTPFGDQTFTCSEQYFMFRKALLFNSPDIAEKILNPTLRPSDYKQLGREIDKYNDAVWKANRVDAMHDALWYKFTQNKQLAEFLLGTGDAVLVETSPYDKVWGVGLGKHSKPGKPYVDWTNIDNWRGENLLGFTLMRVRDELKQIDQNNPI